MWTAAKVSDVHRGGAKERTSQVCASTKVSIHLDSAERSSTDSPDVKKRIASLWSPGGGNAVQKALRFKQGRRVVKIEKKKKKRNTDAQGGGRAMEKF